MNRTNLTFVTPVPARRISEHARLELRVAADTACVVTVEARFSDRTVPMGQYEIAGGRELHKLYPATAGICGVFTLAVCFSGEWMQAEHCFSYEIVRSEVHSTCLLDGCWTSLYHWSDDEARHFNQGLKTMTDEDWKQHIYSMHRIGITSVLIQNVFDSKHYVNQHDMTAATYDGQAFYPSALYPTRFPLAAQDPIEAILTAADECDMVVFPGVGLYAWFDFSPESLQWHMDVTRELFERYGHHKSFYGWYISEEIMGALYHGYDPVPDEKYHDIADFFATYARFVHELTPTKPVALAPNNIDFHLHAQEWGEILPNIDILIPFAFARSENNIPQIAALCKQYDTHFWVDMEIFDFPFDTGLAPKPFDKLLKEIHCYDMLEQVYGYQYTGLMNEPGHRGQLGREDTEVLYAAYEPYYHRVRDKR